MKLYHAPGTCSLAPHIVLREADLPFTLVKVDLQKHTLPTGEDYHHINPKGQVPVLELADGTRLTEGPVIAQFIADQAGNTSLMPASGSLDRYRVMAWQNHITAELHKSFSPLFTPQFDANAKALHRSLLRKKYEWIEQQLSPGLFLTGAAFTAADAYLFAVTRWAKHVDLDLSDLPALMKFMSRVADRPAVQAAMLAEGLAH